MAPHTCVGNKKLASNVLVSWSMLRGGPARCSVSGSCAPHDSSLKLMCGVVKRNGVGDTGHFTRGWERER